MTLMHRVIVLKSGRKIRMVASACTLVNPPAYQYIVDMLFGDNNWERVYVSRLFDRTNILKFLIIFRKNVDKAERFENIHLAKMAKEKYGGQA